MIRLNLALIIGGGVLAFFGGQEYLVSSNTQSDPVEVELADLESGEDPSNNYLKIGEHVALYPGAVYYCYVDESSGRDDDPGNKVEYCFYPIISTSHPFMKELDAFDEKMIEKYGNLDNVPDSEPWPEVAGLKVLVKSRRFKTIGALPLEIDDSVPGVTGLVINQIDSLGSEEEKLLKESLPELNMDDVLILEAGREPASGLKSVGMMGGGVLLIVVGIGLFFVGARNG